VAALLLGEFVNARRGPLSRDFAFHPQTGLQAVYDPRQSTGVSKPALAQKHRGKAGVAD
jgi:hypothetical protein